MKSGLFKGDDWRSIKSIRSNEDAHVAALEGTARKLGGKPAPKPKTQFPIDDAQQVLRARRDCGEPRRGGLPGPGWGDSER